MPLDVPRAALHHAARSCAISEASCLWDLPQCTAGEPLSASDRCLLSAWLTLYSSMCSRSSVGMYTWNMVLPTVKIRKWFMSTVGCFRMLYVLGCKLQHVLKRQHYPQFCEGVNSHALLQHASADLTASSSSGYSQIKPCPPVMFPGPKIKRCCGLMQRKTYLQLPF